MTMTIRTIQSKAYDAARRMEKRSRNPEDPEDAILVYSDIRVVGGETSRAKRQRLPRWPAPDLSFRGDDALYETQGRSDAMACTSAAQ